MPRQLMVLPFIFSLVAMNSVTGAMAQATATYYERSVNGVCNPASTNVCRAVFPVTPSNRFLTVESVSCEVGSSNGRPVIVGRVGTSDTETGEIKRARNLTITTTDGFGGFKLSFVVGNPFLKIAPSRYVVVQINLGGDDFPYNAAVTCIMAGVLTET